MSPPSNQEVYLDANFLIAYLLKNHDDSSGSVALLAALLVSKNKVRITALSLDETFNSLVREKNNQMQAAGTPASSTRLPHAAFYTDLKSAITTLLALPDLELIQYQNDIKKGAEKAVDNIKNYKMKPRDAFHLSYMQDRGIKYIATNDKDFDKIPSTVIKRLCY